MQVSNCYSTHDRSVFDCVFESEIRQAFYRDSLKLTVMQTEVILLRKHEQRARADLGDETSCFYGRCFQTTVAPGIAPVSTVFELSIAGA